MYQVFIRVRQPGGWSETNPAYRIEFGNRVELVYEDQQEARNQATQLKLAIAYLTNAGAPTGAEVEVREV